MGGHNAGELAAGVTPLLGQGVPGAAGDRAGVPSSARSPLCRKRRRRKETWRGRAPSSANCRGPRSPTRGMNVGAVVWRWPGKGSFQAVHPASL